MGVVARDDAGCVLLSASRTIWRADTVEMTELYAADWAVSLAIEHQWPNVTFEGDTSLVVEALNGVRFRGLHAQTLVQNIRSRMGGFVSFSFCFCYRECNEIAHRLAQWASRSSCDNVWIKASPLWIRDLVISDISP